MLRKGQNCAEEIHHHTHPCWCVRFVVQSSHLPSCSGVEDGQTMRVNLGSSEVFITFRVKISDKFRRDKEDIHTEINLSLVQATLGGAVKVPGIYDDHVLQVRSLIPSVAATVILRTNLDPSRYSVPSALPTDW